MWFHLISGAAVPAFILLASLPGCAAPSEEKSPPVTPSTGAAANENRPPAPPAQGKEAPATAPRAEMTSEVVIDNFTYSPVKLTVATGARVTWINHDDVPHTVTSTTKPRLLDSPTLDTDDKFSFVFTKPGVYDYFCAVHPKMTGQVIVK